MITKSRFGDLIKAALTGFFPLRQRKPGCINDTGLEIDDGGGRCFCCRRSGPAFFYSGFLAARENSNPAGNYRTRPMISNQVALGDQLIVGFQNGTAGDSQISRQLSG